MGIYVGIQNPDGSPKWGYIGTDPTGAGYDGAWFKRVYIGGTAAANAPISANDDGHITFAVGSALQFVGAGGIIFKSTTEGISRLAITPTDIWMNNASNYRKVTIADTLGIRVNTNLGVLTTELTGSVANFTACPIQINSTTVIDSSRNGSFVGVTASGNIASTGGNVSAAVDMVMGGWLYKGATAILKGQGAAVADATGAGDVVQQLNALLAQLRAMGLIAT